MKLLVQSLKLLGQCLVPASNDQGETCRGEEYACRSKVAGTEGS